MKRIGKSREALRFDGTLLWQKRGLRFPDCSG